MRTSFRFLVAVAIVACSKAGAAECGGAATESLLIGTWHAAEGRETMEIRRDGDKLVWVFERQHGVVTDRWGEKVPAAGTGVIEAMDGCRALLKGRYTRFDGLGERSRPAVGWPMDWKFRVMDKATVMAEGMGYGRQPFKARWLKESASGSKTLAP